MPNAIILVIYIGLAQNLKFKITLNFEATFFLLNSGCSVEQRDLKNFAQFGYFLLSFEIGIKQHNITI